jgi:hypothetical protein
VSQKGTTYDANNFTKSLSNLRWNNEGTAVSSGDSTYYYFKTTSVGVKSINKETFSVYPNPTNGKFTISSSSKFNTLEIFTLTGVRVYSKLNLTQQSSFEIDLTDCKDGIYFVKVNNGTEMLSKKIIIQKL